MRQCLTHLPLDKMATIGQTIFFLDHFFFILIEVSLEFVPKVSIDNNPALVGRRKDGKPLSEPRPTRLNDAYMRH